MRCALPSILPTSLGFTRAEECGAAQGLPFPRQGGLRQPLPHQEQRGAEGVGQKGSGSARARAARVP